MLWYQALQTVCPVPVHQILSVDLKGLIYPCLYNRLNKYEEFDYQDVFFVVHDECFQAFAVAFLT